MPTISDEEMKIIIDRLRKDLDDLHKRSIKELEDEERLRAEFEKRKTR